MNIVEKIHAEIDEAQEIILKEAVQTLTAASLKDINKGERLKALGFVNTPAAINAAKVMQEKEGASERAELVEAYKREYPLLKFLTEEAMASICEKYGLIMAPISHFIKEVPTKNLEEIEQAKPLINSLKAKAKTTTKIIYYSNSYSGPSFCSKKQARKLGLPKEINKAFHSQFKLNDYLKANYKGADKFQYLCDEMTETIEDRSGLFIAAPPSNFNLKGLNKTSKFGFSIIKTREIKDPVVFRYCKGGLQVLTKWGDEASDPALLNEINN